MKLAVGLPSSASDEQLKNLIHSFFDVESTVHFWLSDNFRPDNVLFRIERLMSSFLSQSSKESESNFPNMVPFLPLAKYPPWYLQELILSAHLHFPWFKHFVVGAGDQRLRKYFKITPKELIRRMQLILDFMNDPLSESFKESPLICVDVEGLPVHSSLNEKITVIAAVQGKKMLMTALGRAGIIVYNGNPLTSRRLMEILQQKRNLLGKSELGCYLMCYLTDGKSSWPERMLKKSISTFQSIITTVLSESRLSVNEQLSDELDEDVINQVGFQGTTQQFLDVIDKLKDVGISYLVIGGPATWQDITLLNILNSI